MSDDNLNQVKVEDQEQKQISIDEKNKQKKLFLIFLVAIGLFIIFILVFSASCLNKQKEKNSEDTDLNFLDVSTIEVLNETTTTIDSATTTITSTTKITTIKKNSSNSADKTTSTSLSVTPDYIKASNIYKTSGYYFQFLNCRGTPGVLTMKKGTKFMLDNRDDKTRKFVIFDRNYNIGAYNYTIVTADKIGKHYITCDGGGAAQVTVQP